ncbi:MAG: hypothetical protein K2O45_05200, partial [Oscillospiraceae bacterium]|nr:hypothetical protein [Oscillospiraceae bacterium]
MDAESFEQLIVAGEIDPPSQENFAPFDPFVPPDASWLPPFPVNSLPPVLCYMAKAAAENLQVAVDMTAVAGLAVA